MMTENDRRALIAASQAGEAVAELLRFFQEGPASDRPFGDMEVVCKLAEALKLAANIEVEHLEQLPHCREEASETNRLAGVCANYIDGWAG